jgi:PAS domain S-box-containing protein
MATDVNILIGKDSVKQHWKGNRNQKHEQPAGSRTQDQSQQTLYSVLYERILNILGEINTGLAIVESNSQKLLFVNQAFCRISAYEPDEIFKMQSFLNLFKGSDLKNYKAEIAGISIGGTRSFNAILTLRKNRKLYVEITAHRFSLNNESRTIMILRDVTKIVSENLMKKLMEAARQESEKRYRSLINNVKDYGIFMLDREGRIISWNAGAERILGYKESEVILKKITIFFESNREKGKTSLDLLEKAMKRGNAEFELQLIRKDSVKIWASATITRIEDGESDSDILSLIIRDLTKSKAAEERLSEQEMQLRSLAKHLQDAREEERLRLARELHDEFSQMLTVLRMDLTVLSHTISKIVTEPFKRISLLEKISSISELLEKTIRSTRRIITELRPAVLDELGLYTAIQWQAQEFENRTRIRCKIIRMQHDISLDRNTSTAIFRILQEGLTNVAKHSGASNVVISLKVNHDHLVLEIKDNGKGIDKNKLRAPTSTGLLGIRERVMALDGNFEIQSEKERGTLLRVSVPYKQEE